MYIHMCVCVSGQESTRSRLPIGLLINRPPTLPRCVAHKKRQMKFKLQFRLLCVCVVCCHLVPYKWSLSSKKLATTTTKTAPTLSPARPLHCSMCQAIRQSPLTSYTPFIACLCSPPYSPAVVKFALPAALMTPLICFQCLGLALDCWRFDCWLGWTPLSFPFPLSFAQVCFRRRRRCCRHAKLNEILRGLLTIFA